MQFWHCLMWSDRSLQRLSSRKSAMQGARERIISSALIPVSAQKQTWINVWKDVKMKYNLVITCNYIRQDMDFGVLTTQVNITACKQCHETSQLPDIR